MILPGFFGNRKQLFITVGILAILALVIGLVVGVPLATMKTSLEKANDILDKYPLIDG